MSITIPEGVATKPITIKGVPVSVPSPYAPEHVLRKNEADVMNQVYAENIRNNTANIIAKMIEMAGGDATAVDPAEAQAAIDTYVASYDFGVRSSGGGRTTDPIRAEAILNAIVAVKNAIVDAGQVVKDYTAKAIREKAVQAVDGNPKFLEQAAAIVAQRNAISIAL